jgi:hypothetical protein
MTEGSGHLLKFHFSTPDKKVLAKAQRFRSAGAFAEISFQHSG